jgi:hypothetical protein
MFKYFIIAAVILGFTGALAYLCDPKPELEEIMMCLVFFGAGGGVIFLLTHFMMWIGTIGESTPTPTGRRPPQ